MSSFNPATFETQRMLAPVQMEAGARENEGIRYIGQSAMAIPEMMMRKAESDTKIAAFQQEQQLNQFKLQQMMALDQAGMSRYQVESMKLSTEAQKIALEKAQEEVKLMREGGSFDERIRKEKLKEIRLGLMGRTPEERLASGYVDDPEHELGWRKAASPDELAARREAYTKFQQDQRKSSDYGDYGQMSRDYLRVLQMISDPRKSLDMSPEHMQSLQSMADDLRRRLTAAGVPVPSLGVPEPGQPQPTQPPAPTQPGAPAPATTEPNPFKGRNDVIGFHGSKLYDSPMWKESPFWSELAPNQATKGAITIGLASYASLLANRMSSKGLAVDETQMGAYARSFVERDPAAFALMLRFADYDDETIKLLLRTRQFGNLRLGDDSIASVMSIVDKDTKDLLAQLAKKEAEAKK